MSVLYKLIPACIDMHVHTTYSKIGHAIKGKGKTVLASEKVITHVM
jgi:predicted metal-dependent phosphoesterase TrpH